MRNLHTKYDSIGFNIQYLVSFQWMKIEFDIFNREFFRTVTFSLKFQKKAQVSMIYMKNIVFLLPSCTTGTRSVIVRILYATSFQWSTCFGYRGQQIGLYNVHQISGRRKETCTAQPTMVMLLLLFFVLFLLL